MNRGGLEIRISESGDLSLIRASLGGSIHVNGRTAPVSGLFSVEMVSSAKRPPVRKSSFILQQAAGPDGIVAQLQKGWFGTFNDALKEIRPLIPEEIDLELPRVVVVGSRDAGKSSLLETLTKCAIFPRDKGQCTRMPIKFQLQQVQTSSECSCQIVFNGISTLLEDTDDILAKVTEIMQDIDNFSDQELVISVKQVCMLLKQS